MIIGGILFALLTFQFIVEYWQFRKDRADMKRGLLLYKWLGGEPYVPRKLSPLSDEAYERQVRLNASARRAYWG